MQYPPAVIFQKIGRDREDVPFRILDEIAVTGANHPQEHLLAQILGLLAVLYPAQKEADQGSGKTGPELAAKPCAGNLVDQVGHVFLAAGDCANTSGFTRSYAIQFRLRLVVYYRVAGDVSVSLLKRNQ